MRTHLYIYVLLSLIGATNSFAMQQTLAEKKHHNEREIIGISQIIHTLYKKHHYNGCAIDISTDFLYSTLRWVEHNPEQAKYAYPVMFFTVMSLGKTLAEHKKTSWEITHYKRRLTNLLHETSTLQERITFTSKL